MKRRAPFLALLTLLALPGVSHAQLWVENLNATNLTFAFRGLDSLGVLSEEDQGAGARLNVNFDVPGQTLRIHVTNLSGGWRTVGAGAEQALVKFGTGTLTGFGFETNPGNLWANAFASWSNTAFNAPGVWGSDAINFVLNQNYTLNGGGAAQPYYMDLGTSSSGNVHAGLASGHGATFRFRFTSPASGFDAATFNPYDFFFRDNDADPWDMSFRFQQTSGLHSGRGAQFSGCYGSCAHPCDDDGSDKVAVAFHLEEDLQVPEPSTYGLIGAAALLGLVVTRRLRRR